MYELERKGFQHADDTRVRIVVYGGNGFFGRLVVEDLLQNTNAQIVIASRTAKQVDVGHPDRIQFFQSDVNDLDSVRKTINGAAAVVCCSGPYQGHSLTLLRACIEKKIHYVDVADDRDFVIRCHQLGDEIKNAGIIAFVGCSVVPGIATLLTKYAKDMIGSVEETRICITPGTRHPRGVGSFRCLLETVGEEYLVDQNSKPRTVRGWSEREEVHFPAPIGRRWVYSIVDVADYYLQPLYFSTKKTVFKIGAELDVLNRCLSFVSWVKGYLGASMLEWFVPMARPAILLSSIFGTTQGGVMVDVRTQVGGSEAISLAVFREERGEIIPAFLPSLAVKMILEKELQSTGLADLSQWLPLNRFGEELAKRRIKLALRESNSTPWTGLNY